MLGVSGTTIYLTRGDTAYVTLTAYDIEGELYELQDGDAVVCHVRDVPTSGDLMFTGETTVDVEDQTITWYIAPEDTAELAPGKYWWDAQLTTESGDVFTFISASYDDVPCFIILDEETQ